MNRPHYLLLLVCLTFLGCASLNGQSKDNLGAAQEAQSLEELRDQIYGTIPDSIASAHERAAFLFSHFGALNIVGLSENRDVYTEHEPLINYLEDIVNLLLPAELKSEDIKVHVLKNAQFNAFMTVAGVMYINIGLFNHIESEAALAAIIAHEIAHYQERHGLKRFINQTQGDFRGGLLVKAKVDRSEFSIQNELDCDEYAAQWIKEAGYAPNGIVELMQNQNSRMETVLLRYQDVWKHKRVTHPTSEERLELAEARTAEFATGERFLVSEEKFTSFKRFALTESLELLLSDLRFAECTELAFASHLREPDNPVYVFYLMESIRKACYLNVQLWNKNFITYRYHEVIDKGKGKLEKLRMKNHFFTEFRGDLIGLAGADLDKLPGNFYWNREKPIFISNEEAFDFFANLGEKLGNAECVLSLALSITNSKGISNQIVERYLEFPNARYPEFARTLLAGTTTSSLPNKKLTVYNRFGIRIRNDWTQCIVHGGGDEDIVFGNKLMTEVLEAYPERKMLSLMNLKAEQAADFDLFQSLMEFSRRRTYSIGERPKLHILEPAYWYLMKKYEVNEIEFVDLICHDVVNRHMELAEFIELVNSSHRDLIDREKRHRYADVGISYVMDKGNSIMKGRYSGSEKKLPYKTSALKGLKEVIEQQLREKDERTQELNSRVGKEPKKRDKK